VIVSVLIAGRTARPERQRIDATPKDQVFAAVLVVAAIAGWAWTLAAAAEIIV